MKSVVFTFGRMNPPTTGHQLLVNKVVMYARQIGAAPRVYLSHSVGKKDPLQYDKKIAFARAAFGSLVKKSNARTVIEVLKGLEKEGFTHVTMFAGSDRVPEFTTLINKYNGKEYTFDKIEVKSAGERDPDADDVSGMSASKMRELAKSDKVAEFLRGAPNTLKTAQAKNMFTAVRKALLGEDVMEYGPNERFLEFIMESDEKETDNLDLPSETEIMKILDNMDDISDLDLDDADAAMLDVIMGHEHEEEKEKVHEGKILSSQARQKLSQRMKSMSKRLARLRQIKAKQMPAQERLRLRARKAALMALRKRATGKKDLDYNSLSRSQRIAVDTALVQRFGKNLNRAVDTLSKRILPKVRSAAQKNVAKARDVKESANVIYPGTKKQVPDQKKDNPLNLDPQKLNVLDTDPTLNDRAAPDPEKAHLYKNRKATHFSKVDEGRKSAADKDARDAGDTNIIYQMRKTVNSRGEHETSFADGKKAHISINDAKKLLAKFDALRLPKDKHEFTIQAGRSLASFRDALAHGLKHETDKKISLGGKNFKEFYLGVGRSRTVSAYDNDEPPGTRRVAEAKSIGGVDPDANDDPNVSRKTNQKLDLLLRLGLSGPDELQKYRRALRASKKQALASPEMRKKLADLLDKLIDLTTQDPATYSRVRYNVQKEAVSLLNKAEKSGVAVDIIFEVFSRGYEKNENINEAFDRVNSFIAGGKAADMDKDLSEKVKEPTGGLKDACWSGYTAVGMKMKNGRKVPNCVPKEEVEEAKANWDKQARFAKYDTIASRGSQKKAYVDRSVTALKKNVAKTASDAMKDYLAKGGTVKKIEPGKQTIKSYVKPKKYMTPNQASRVTEQMSTHDEVPLQKRVKRVKSFHAWHPKVQEMYTGSEPVSGNRADPANRFVGTNAIRQNYASVTPGQGANAGEIAVAKYTPEKVDYTSSMVKKTHTEVDQSKDTLSKKHLSDIRKALGGIRESYDLNESFSAGFELAPFARDYGITVQSAFEHHPSVQEQLEDEMNEAIYQGREVPLNKPMKGDVKKSKVYVKDPSTGNVKKVNFGDKKLSIKKDQPARKRSYCARSSGQGNLNKKTSANYWSRRAWDC